VNGTEDFESDLLLLKTLSGLDTLELFNIQSL